MRQLFTEGKRVSRGTTASFIRISSRIISTCRCIRMLGCSECNLSRFRSFICAYVSKHRNLQAIKNSSSTLGVSDEHVHIVPMARCMPFCLPIPTVMKARSTCGPMSVAEHGVGASQWTNSLKLSSLIGCSSTQLLSSLTTGSN